MSSKYEFKKVKLDGQEYTKIKLGKGVQGKIRRIVNAYCVSNPDKYKYLKSSKLFDYYMFQGDYIRLALLA